MNKNYFLSLVFAAGIFNLSFGQISEKIFYDNFPEEGGTVTSAIQFDDYMIIGGESHDIDWFIPCLKAVDQNGNILWSTSDTDVTSVISGGKLFSFFLGEDNFIYSFLREGTGNLIDDYQIWKVDPVTGNILWKNEVDISPGNWVEVRFLDLGPDKITLLALRGSSDNELLVYSKNDGALLESHHLGFGNDSSVLMTVDEEQNLYCSRQDSLIKFPVTNYSQRAWSVHLDGFEFFTGLEYDFFNGQVITFGSPDDVFDDDATMAAFNPNTGEQNWYLIPDENRDVNYSSSVFSDNSLYVTWQHSTVGGSTYQMLTHKVNLLTGTMDWGSKVFAIGTDEQAALDFILDDDGNLIMTGYFEAANFGPGKWLLVKLSGQTGEIVYTNHFTVMDSQANESNSSGRKVLKIGDQYFAIGILQDATYDYHSHLTVINFNPDTGEEIQKWFIDGEAQLYTKLIDAIPIDGGSKVVCFLQEGAHGNLVMLDANGAVLWEKKIFINTHFGADRIQVTPNNEIVVFGVEGSSSGSEYPYVELNLYVDDFAILRYDLNGNLLYKKEGNFNSVFGFQDDDFYTTGMIASDTRSLIFGKSEDTFDDNVFVIQVEDDVLSHYDIPSKHNYFGVYNNALAIDENTAWVYTPNSNNGITELDLQSGNDVASYFNTGSTFDVKMDNQNRAISVGRKTFRPSVLSYSTISNAQQWNYSNDDIFGVFEKVAIGLDLVFALGKNDDTDEYFLTCLNLNTGDELWTTNLGEGFTNYCKGRHLAFNPITNEIVVASLLSISPVSNDFKDVLIELFDINGDRVSHFERQGVAVHEDVEITGLNFSSTGRLLLSVNIMLENGNDNNAPNGMLLSFGDDVNNFYYKGKIFYDLNENGSKQIDEPFLSVGNIWIDSLEFGYIPNSDSEFGFFFNEGQHSYTYLPDEDWSVTTDSNVFHFDAGQTPVSEELCVGIYPDTLYSELDVVMNGLMLRCFEQSRMYIDVFENGTTIGSATVTVEVPDDITNIQFLDLMPDTVIGNEYLFTIDEVGPNFSDRILFSFTVPGIEAIGETLTFTTTANAVDTNGQVINSHIESYADIVVCSYDPNDKLVNPIGVGPEHYTLFDTELDYTIRFQNTGNGEARRVRLVDTLDSNLNWNSLKVNQASHPLSEVRRLDNIVEFIFDPIVLPYEAIDTLGSQGFVSFSIQPNENLPESTIIENSAAIYFDFNPPIFTNSVNNTYVSSFPTAVADEFSIMQATLIPNPFLNNTLVEIKNYNGDAINAHIYDMYGRQVGFQKINNELTALDLDYLSSAIYFIKLSTSDGMVIETLKAMKL